MNSNYRIQLSEFVNETSTNSVILFIIYIDDVTNTICAKKVWKLLG